MRHHSAPFQFLSISRQQSAGNCASADELGHGADDGFVLLQQQKMSRTRQVDNPDALAELLAECVAIARRRRFVIGPPLDHESWGRSGAPPLFERHTAAGREVGGQDPPANIRPAPSIFGSDAGDSQRAPSTVTRSLPFILTSVALRKCVPSGVEGAMRPPAASRVTLRTSDGRSAAKQRATRLPKAWPTRCAGPQSIASTTPATSAAKSCSSYAVERAAALSQSRRMLTHNGL